MMDAIERSLREEMKSAIRMRCWRVACARIRGIAKHKEEKEGIPYNKTLIMLDYDYYRRQIKRKF